MKAQKIYLGNIVTVNDAQPVAEAVAVAEGKIIKVGNKQDVLNLQDDNTEIIDLGNKTMLPGFIDAHGHLGLEILVANWADIQPSPYAGVDCIDDLVEVMKMYIHDNNIKPGEWAVGFGYSNVDLKEGRHPDKFDLDRISTEHPIVVWHASVHFFAANTLGLSMLGIDENSVDPAGGSIRRVPGTNEPNGLCEGTVRYTAVTKLPMGDMNVQMAKLKKAEALNNKYGITTIQEGGTRGIDAAILKEAAKRNILNTDVIIYPLEKREEFINDSELYKGGYSNHLKMGGIKMVSDGSFAGTAKMRQPYKKRPENTPEGFDGLLYESKENMIEFIKLAFERNTQLMIHVVGDGSIQTFLEAYEEVVKETKTDTSKRRDVILHFMFGDEKQSDKVKELNLFPSLMTPRTYFVNDIDEERYGYELISNNNPAGDFVKRNVKFSLHMDSPCFPPDMLLVMHSAVNRVTKAGKLYGPDKRVSPLDALKGITINAAYQYFEEDIKGSIEEGKLADLVIVDKNPLEVEYMQIKDVKVLETIKEGKTIYTA